MKQSWISQGWTQKTDKLISHLGSTKNGLTQKEAGRRLKGLGGNLIADKRRRTALVIFVSQLQNWLMILLFAASLIAYFLGERLDALVILGIVFLSILFGFFQEHRAERTVEKLKKYITHKAKVLRDGKWEEIDSSQLVPGDIISLRIGDRVPADIRLLESDKLSIDESILTGESLPVNKQTEPLADKNIPLQDQTNMAFAGTYVVSGIARGIVVATGDQTEFGKTAALLTQKQPETDFQKQIKRFSAFLSKVVVLMTLFVFGTNALLGKGMFDSLWFAVALAVGIAPELLPMIMTVTLSQGATKMANKKVIVKRLMAVEDFGNIDTLCTDKTGTLTEGDFALSSYQTVDGEKSKQVLVKALLCSSGFAHQGKTANQVDKALWQSQESQGLLPKLSGHQLTDENEFDFERRMMSVVVKEKESYTLIVKGAAGSVLPACQGFLAGGQARLFENKKVAEVANQIKRLENSGYRVIVVAQKKVNQKESSIKDERDLTLVGLLLFTDPVKKGVKKSLDLFEKLGVKIKILSGDSAEIVRRVAVETGLISEQAKEEVVDGEELDKLGEKAFVKYVFEKSLFARIRPEQKRRIVASLNQQGHIVGFLGDGINDAQALRAADVGIAVNTGSDVAKEAADIVLLKKDLSVLAEGIEQGRRTFGNITKYILNTISANYGNMFTVATSSLFLSFIPLLPKQILLNNFISDIPLLAVATDNVDPSFTKKPKRWDIGLLAHFMLYFGLVSSVFDFATILPLVFIWKAPPELFRTAWFVESSLSEIMVTFAVRTQLPFYKSSPSRWLLALSFLSGSMVAALPFLSLGTDLFSFVSLPTPVAIWIACVVSGYFISVEIVKKFFFARFSL